MGDRQEIIEALNAADLDGETLVKHAETDEIKNKLKQSTKNAVEEGVFGVPTMIIDKQLFWGNDQFDHMEMHLNGNDGVTEALLDAALNRKRGIDRKKISG